MSKMQFLDLKEAPPTDENIAKVLGYPTIEVNPEARGKQCSNCGSNTHTYEDCKLPKMDQLLEMFGQSDCYDSTPKAVKSKKEKVDLLYQQQKDNS